MSEKIIDKNCDGFKFDGKIIVNGDVRVNGNLECGELEINRGFKLTVAGKIVTDSDVTSRGDIVCAGDFVCRGDIFCHGDITAGGFISSRGNISSAENISCGGDLTAGGFISSGGFISCGKNILCRGDIFCGGYLSSGGDICGYSNISSAGNISSGGYISCGKNITSAGDIFFSTHVKFLSKITAKLLRISPNSDFERSYWIEKFNLFGFEKLAAAIKTGCVDKIREKIKPYSRELKLELSNCKYWSLTEKLVIISWIDGKIEYTKQAV